MPNKANAKKALRQAKKREVLNTKRKNDFKKAIKKTLKTTDTEQKAKSAIMAQKALDKAAKLGIIKKNTASRKISRLMKKVNTAKVEKK